MQDRVLMFTLPALVQHLCLRCTHHLRARLYWLEGYPPQAMGRIFGSPAV